MAFHDPITVELFDQHDRILTPVTRPISITHNIEAHRFDYSAIQVETYDDVMRKVLTRWEAGELLQYRIRGRFGTSTGDVNSIYGYDIGSGEFAFYGRSHKEIMFTVLGFPQPANPNAETQSAERKRYTGSALKVMRDVLRDNVVTRLGIPMRFQSGDLGNPIDIDFRFDEIHAHFYTDTADKGGALLEDNGNIIFDIHRDFRAGEYVLTAREPTRHRQMIEAKSGMIERWQFTATRAEADRVIVGGPGEKLARHFADRAREQIRHRRFPAETFTEDTNPDTGVDAGQDPTTAQIMEAISKFGDGKLTEYGEKSSLSGQINESPQIYLGGKLMIGDWARIGVDNDLPLGEQEFEKAVVTWTVDDGYKVQLTKPEDNETTELALLEQVMVAVRELSTRTRRR